MQRVLGVMRHPRRAGYLARLWVVHRLSRTRFRFWPYPSCWGLGWRADQQGDAAPIGERRFLVATPNQGAGVGHQLANWIAGWAFAREFKLAYVPHPLNPPLWGDFLGLAPYSSPYEEVVRNSAFRSVRLPLVLGEHDLIGKHVMSRLISERNRGDGVVFRLEEDQSLHDQTVATDFLRSRYAVARQRQPVAVVYDKSRVGVAVHVRRGDVAEMRQQDSGNWQRRWLSDNYVLAIVEGLWRELGADELDVHVFSQGDPKQFSRLSRRGRVHLHMDTDVFWTFHQLVEADVLMMSPSSFSYVAALISRGVKVARSPWWHHLPDTADWVLSDTHGNLRAGAVAEGLRATGHAVKVPR